jgi:hypothetical protein
VAALSKFIAIWRMLLLEIALQNRILVREWRSAVNFLIVDPLQDSLAGLSRIGDRSAPQLSNIYQATPRARMQYLGAKVGARCGKRSRQDLSRADAILDEHLWSGSKAARDMTGENRRERRRSRPSLV